MSKSASNVVARIERLKDKCHALLEREAKLEHKLGPIETELKAYRSNLAVLQTHLAVLRGTKADSAKIERQKDLCAKSLARIEKLERKAKPLETKIAAIRTKYAAEHGKLMKMRK